jgi:hypothetical protein
VCRQICAIKDATNLQHHVILHSLVVSPHDQREQDELHENEARKVATRQSIHPSAKKDATERIEEAWDFRNSLGTTHTKFSIGALIFNLKMKFWTFWSMKVSTTMTNNPIAKTKCLNRTAWGLFRKMNMERILIQGKHSQWLEKSKEWKLCEFWNRFHRNKVQFRPWLEWNFSW